MSGNGKSGHPPHECHSKNDPPCDYDAQLTWPREQLARMNDRFVERVERAIAAGDEHQPGPGNAAPAR